MSSHAMIGPYFIEDAEGNCVTVNSHVYRTQVIDRFQADLLTVCEEKELDYTEQIFQQDGAPCYAGRDNLDYIQECFSGGVISRNGEFLYPPRSPDLTPLDSFVLGLC